MPLSTHTQSPAKPALRPALLPLWGNVDDDYVPAQEYAFLCGCTTAQPVHTCTVPARVSGHAEWLAAQGT